MVLTAGWIIRLLAGEHLVLCFGGKGGGGTTVVQPPAAPDPLQQIQTEAQVNRYNVRSPFGTRTWTQPGAVSPMGFDAWLSQTYPNGAPSAQQAVAGAMGGGNDRAGRPRNRDNNADWGTGWTAAAPGVDVNAEYQKYLEGVNAQNAGGQWVMEETLTPSQQRQFDARNAIAEELLARAKTQIPGIPADPFKATVDGSAVKDAMYRRLTSTLDPHFDREESRLEQKLVNQGIPMGAEAFKSEYGDFARARDTSYERAALDAVLAGAGEEDNQFRRDLATRQQNYNELAALLGGQQLNTVAPTGSGTVDVGGAFAREQAARNTAYQGNIAAMNAEQSGRNSMMGGLFGLGSAVLPWLL